MSRALLAAVAAACVAFAPCALVLVDPAQAEPTTVTGNKSTQADRMGGGGGHRRSARVIRGRKSNQGERMGGGGGRTNRTDNKRNLNSSRSNNY